MIAQGSWVQIHRIVLPPEGRAENLPEETKKVSLEMWDKGFLTHEASFGDVVEIITAVGRKETGTLVALNPGYSHGFGVFVPEVLEIDRIVKTALWGEKR